MNFEIIIFVYYFSSHVICVHPMYRCDLCAENTSVTVLLKSISKRDRFKDSGFSYRD